MDSVSTSLGNVLSAQQARRTNLIARHPIASVIVIMFALVWAGLIPDALASQGVTSFRLPIAVQFFVGWTPAIAAILVAGMTDGKKGIAALLRRFLIVRVNVVWYLLAFFGLAVVILGGIGLFVLFGGAMPVIPLR